MGFQVFVALQTVPDCFAQHCSVASEINVLWLQGIVALSHIAGKLQITIAFDSSAPWLSAGVICIVQLSLVG
jgi:hypothetical protein